MTHRRVENGAQTFPGEKGRGDVWRVDQVYTKIILNFYKKLKFIPVFLEGVVVLSKKTNKQTKKQIPIFTSMREQKHFIKITISKQFICMRQLLVSQEKERTDFQLTGCCWLKISYKYI